MNADTMLTDAFVNHVPSAPAHWIGNAGLYYEPITNVRSVKIVIAFASELLRKLLRKQCIRRFLMMG